MPRGRALLGVALAVASCGALAACSVGGSDPPELLPPESFTATAKEISASLSWSTNPESAPVDGFQLYRGNRQMAELEADATSYVDKTIVPGTAYEYELRAVDEPDDQDEELVRSAPASTTIKIAVPPLKAARLEGVFTVDADVVSQSGFKNTIRGGTYSWSFKPKCKQGACEVRWQDFDFDARAILKRKGTTYSGTYRGYFNTTCASARTTSAVKIRIKVTDAEAKVGVWRATAIKGTLSAVTAPQLSCVESRKRESLKGSLVGG